MLRPLVLDDGRERDHHPVNNVFARAIRQHAHHIPRTILGDNFQSFEYQRSQHLVDIRIELGVAQKRYHVTNGLPLVTGKQLEHRLGLGCGAFAVSFRIENQGSSIRAIEEIVSVLVGAREHLDLALQFVVHRQQFFIARLRLFFRGLGFSLRRTCRLTVSGTKPPS
jgi:hypothetical protein